MTTARGRADGRTSRVAVVSFDASVAADSSRRQSLHWSLGHFNSVPTVVAHERQQFIYAGGRCMGCPTVTADHLGAYLRPAI